MEVKKEEMIKAIDAELRRIHIEFNRHDITRLKATPLMRIHQSEMTAE